MAVPRGVVVTCPGCDVPLELGTCAFSVTMSESEEHGKGIIAEMAAWAAHTCHPSKEKK